jgi:hypothetical protein
LQHFRQDLAAIFDCVLAGHYKRLSHLPESEAFVRLQIELLRNRNTVADDGYVLKSVQLALARQDEKEQYLFLGSRPVSAVVFGMILGLRNCPTRASILEAGSSQLAHFMCDLKHILAGNKAYLGR